MKPNDPRWDSCLYMARKPGKFPNLSVRWNRRGQDVEIGHQRADCLGQRLMFMDRRTARLLHRRLGQLLEDLD